MLNLDLNLPRVDTGAFHFRPRPEMPAAPRVRLALLPWMWRYRAELTPGKPLDLARHAYLRGLYTETSKAMVVCKSSQAGVSEYLISYAIHACDARDATVLYLFPTDTHVSDFSAARLGPAIESSDYLSSIVVEARHEKKRGADRVTLKRVRDRFLYFRGSQVKPSGQAPQLKSIDADIVIFDEWDEMDPRAPAIARKRLDHSSLAEERAVSTPTYPGRGIHALYQASDQRTWHVRCTRCNRLQPIAINDVVIEWDELERPIAWHGQAEGRAYAACKACGGELDRLGAGEWVPAQRSHDRVGYHISKLFSPLHELQPIVQRLQTLDETERRECYNQDLGQPYRPRGGGLDDSALDACRRDYAHGFRPGPCYMGIDVGAAQHVVIRGRRDPETGERPQLFAGEIVGWDGVLALWRQYKPVMTVVDALPETTKAREFQDALPKGRCWLAYYSRNTEGLKDAEPVRKDEDEGNVHLDRTRTLDATVARFLEQTNTLPANARAIRDYYDQMKASVRVVEDKVDREAVARYVETAPDHYFHAENLCTVASLLTKPGIGALAQAGARGWN